jgi:hypothetical protein
MYVYLRKQESARRFERDLSSSDMFRRRRDLDAQFYEDRDRAAATMIPTLSSFAGLGKVTLNLRYHAPYDVFLV